MHFVTRGSRITALHQILWMPANGKTRTVSCPVAINTSVMWLHWSRYGCDCLWEKYAHGAHAFYDTFQTTIPTEFWPFFPRYQPFPETQVTVHLQGWESNRLAGHSLLTSPIPFSWTGTAAVRATPPALWWLQEKGSCTAAPCSTASWILARPISHGLWPNRIQVTGSDWQWEAWLDCSRAASQIPFTHLDALRIIYFGCSKHTSSTLQRHFGFVWNKGKEATVNTQLLIVHYKRKEQCDQKGHSQLSHGYSAPSLGLTLDSSQRM